MERLEVGPARATDPSSVPLSEDFALPSRAAALTALRAALLAQAGPALVTGEAGSGKTWVWRRLVAGLPGSWRGVAVDLTPAIDPAGFYRLIGHGLGLSGESASRLGLVDFLREEAADGVRWVLVVDESQNASDAVWEEVRVLTNRLGQPDGCAAIVLVGQTPLARRVSTRALAALEARLSIRVHLRPLDFEEARTFLNRATAGRAADLETLERAHRDTAGNPRRLLQWAAPDPGERTPQLVKARRAATPATVPLASAPAWDGPLTGPARPPIEVEDGVVEVGWEPVAEVESLDEPLMETASVVAHEQNSVAAGSSEREETINDHYTALQAYSEWARNQGRNPSADSVEAPPIPPVETEEVEDDPPRLPTHAGVWAEGQQGFAPYSQLFSRLKQGRDSR